MGIDKISAFNIYAPELIDKLRGKFATTTLRDALDPSYRTEGLMTYCEDTQSLYMLIGGITNSDWVKIASSSGTPKEKVTDNNNAFTGIEIGLNVFNNPTGSRDVIVQFKDANGNVINLTPTIETNTISVMSGVTYAGAELIII